MDFFFFGGGFEILFSLAFFAVLAVTSSTTYYATFQVESGDRMELRLSGAEYGMLAEGDRGRLTFQGTRYLSFERE